MAPSFHSSGLAILSPLSQFSIDWPLLWNISRKAAHKYMRTHRVRTLSLVWLTVLSPSKTVNLLPLFPFSLSRLLSQFPTPHRQTTHTYRQTDRTDNVFWQAFYYRASPMRHSPLTTWQSSKRASDPLCAASGSLFGNEMGWSNIRLHIYITECCCRELLVVHGLLCLSIALTVWLAVWMCMKKSLFSYVVAGMHGAGRAEYISSRMPSNNQSCASSDLRPSRACREASVLCSMGWPQYIYPDFGRASRVRLLGCTLFSMQENISPCDTRRGRAEKRLLLHAEEKEEAGGGVCLHRGVSLLPVAAIFFCICSMYRGMIELLLTHAQTDTDRGIDI